MAAYPTPPDVRMAYDRDGSYVGYFQPGATSPTNLAGSQISALNSEGGGAGYIYRNQGAPYATNIYGYLVIVFPELRNLTYQFFDPSDSSTRLNAVEYSTNTTNGIDGTWTSGVGYGSGAVQPGYRNNIATTNIGTTAIKGIRLSYNAYNGETLNLHINAWHLYGRPASDQNPDSLRIWQPVTNAEFGTVLDFGDIARGTTSSQSFRVHNQSATKTASSITVALETLYDATPSIIGQFQLSTDNTTWANSVTIANLAPGATSPVIYLRDAVSSGATTGLWACRIVASAGTFQ